MRKILKSKIFLFILTAIIFTGIGVFAATTVSSHDITYKNTTVEDAIDDLYSKAKPEYSGTTTITPTTAEQVLSTNNKILKNDITINPIPSSYKNISDTTITTAADISSGLVAYKADGTRIIGTGTNDCVSGTYTKPANSNVNLSFGFNATRAQVYFNNPNGNGNMVVFYDSNLDESYVIMFTNNTPSIGTSAAHTLNSNGLTTNYDTNGTTYKSTINYYYMACK